MSDFRTPRPRGDTLYLEGVPYQLIGDAVIVGDVITYKASTQCSEPWVDLLIKEFFPYTINETVSRKENGTLDFTLFNNQHLEQKRNLFLKCHRIEKERIDRLPSSNGAKISCIKAYGTYYTVRRLSYAITLQSLLAQNPKGFSMENTMPLILKLLDFLECIHNEQLLHLQIHPSQIYLMAGKELTLDCMNLWRKGDTGLLRTISVDLDYTAPEIRLQNWEEISPATDLYSVAALIYHLLYGNTPRKNYFSLIEPCEIQGMPNQIRAFFRKGLHILPRKRFSTVTEFRSALLALEPLSEKTIGTSNHFIETPGLYNEIARCAL